MSLRKNAVLLVKSLIDSADGLLNKAGNWSGKDRLSAVLKKIKKDVSNGVLPLNVTHPSPRLAHLGDYSQGLVAGTCFWISSLVCSRILH